MSVTAKEILNRSKEKKEISLGCWEVNIKLREIATGKIYNVRSVYTEGKYQGYIEVVERSLLVSVRNFEFLD